MLAPASYTAAATYTTIPISNGDVISRSFQNFTSAVARLRPWPEFIDFSAFDLPDSFSASVDRLKKNFTYFFANYITIVLVCAALSLIGSPLSLIIIAAICWLWILLYIFREDPLLVLGRLVGDRIVLIGLVSVSVLMIWILGVTSHLLWGITAGIDVGLVHGVFRNAQGLFLNEDEAISDGLIGSGNSNRPATLPR